MRVKYRWMTPDEVHRLAEIDRSEEIRTGYEVEGSQLRKIDVMWDTPSYDLEGEGDHTVSYITAFCLDHLKAGGKLMGAFLNEKLVGVGLIRENIRCGMAQLAFLQVSKEYRRQQIGSHLLREMEEVARASEADRIYVSATPSGSAVCFYLSHGFELTAEVVPELLELEPEDIHMLKMLD